MHGSSIAGSLLKQELLRGDFIVEKVVLRPKKRFWVAQRKTKVVGDTNAPSRT